MATVIVRHSNGQLAAWCVVVCSLLGQMPSYSGEVGWHAEKLSSQHLYHSPETPGWTSWMGAWQMPDGSLMACCTQATGKVQPHHKSRDYSGLKIDEMYLHSRDGGKTWDHVSSTDVSMGAGRSSGRGTHANNGPTTIALKDGSLIRRVYGFDYKMYDRLPGTGFLQLSTDGGNTWSAAPTTTDGGKTWSDPSPIQEFLLDPSRFTIQPTRTQRLRDGRIVISGGMWHGQHTQRARYEPFLAVSSDEAKTWKHIPFSGPAYDEAAKTQFNEWDFAELDNGDLLFVGRPDDNSERSEGVLKKKGDGWELVSIRKAGLPHSGHPELLKTKEGPVLHIATTGVHWKTDPMDSWHELPFTGQKQPYRSHYYPVSLQTKDGRIYVFSHRGSDDYYGRYDQVLLMDVFQLAKD